MRCSLVDGLGIGLGVDVGVRRLVWVLRAAAAGLWWECGGRGGVWECGYVVVWDGDGRGRWGGGEAGRRGGGWSRWGCGGGMSVCLSDRGERGGERGGDSGTGSVGCVCFASVVEDLSGLVVMRRDVGC